MTQKKPLKVFKLRPWKHHYSGRIVKFYKTYATVQVWCPICKSWTCNGEQQATKLRIAYSLLYRTPREIIKVGCQEFSPRSAVVAYANKWAKGAIK